MNLNVLIVDDDKMITLLHKVMVTKNKICSNPFLFKDGKEALDFLLTEYKSDELYLVLLDINMPVLNGWEFLDSIQSERFAKELLVVLVTSSVDSGDKVKAKTYPQVIGFLEKPLRTDSCNYIKSLPELLPFFHN
jgi:response regulator of citrate/malate metabolism